MKTVTGHATVDWSEKEAITGAQCGEVGAFESLYRAHSKRVYSVCWRVLKNASEAEDLTQQVFFQLSWKIGTFRDESAFSTWLHRLTINEVLMIPFQSRFTSDGVCIDLSNAPRLSGVNVSMLKPSRIHVFTSRQTEGMKYED